MFCLRSLELYLFELKSQIWNIFSPLSVIVYQLCLRFLSIFLHWVPFFPPLNFPVFSNAVLISEFIGFLSPAQSVSSSRRSPETLHESRPLLLPPVCWSKRPHSIPSRGAADASRVSQCYFNVCVCVCASHAKYVLRSCSLKIVFSFVKEGHEMASAGRTTAFKVKNKRPYWVRGGARKGEAKLCKLWNEELNLSWIISSNSPPAWIPPTVVSQLACDTRGGKWDLQRAPRWLFGVDSALKSKPHMLKHLTKDKRPRWSSPPPRQRTT